MLLYFSNLEPAWIPALNKGMYGRVLLSAGKKPYIALKPLPQESVVDTCAPPWKSWSGEPGSQSGKNRITPLYKTKHLGAYYCEVLFLWLQSKKDKNESKNLRTLFSVICLSIIALGLIVYFSSQGSGKTPVGEPLP